MRPWVDRSGRPGYPQEQGGETLDPRLMPSSTNLRELSCGVWASFPTRSAPIYRSIWSRQSAGCLERAEPAAAKVILDGVGGFTASMSRDGSVCEILELGPSEPSSWGYFPSVRRLTDAWQSCELGGRKMAARYEQVPLLARAIAICDVEGATSERVYLGLNGKGVRLYPILYWPLLIPLAWRQRLPKFVYDPRLVIGMERPAPVAEALALRSVVVCLCLLATELGECLEYQPGH